MNSKIILPALLGSAIATQAEKPEISVFADNLFNMVEDGDDSIKAKIKATKDYSEVFKQLNHKKETGQLGSTDAFKSMDFIANENGFKIERH